MIKLTFNNLNETCDQLIHPTTNEYYLFVRKDLYLYLQILILKVNLN